MSKHAQHTAGSWLSRHIVLTTLTGMVVLLGGGSIATGANALNPPTREQELDDATTWHRTHPHGRQAQLERESWEARRDAGELTEEEVAAGPFGQ